MGCNVLLHAMLAMAGSSMIGKTTHRSALPEEYRYGHKWVRHWSEGSPFAVIVMHSGACNGGTGAPVSTMTPIRTRAPAVRRRTLMAHDHFHAAAPVPGRSD